MSDGLNISIHYNQKTRSLYNFTQSYKGCQFAMSQKRKVLTCFYTTNCRVIVWFFSWHNHETQCARNT
jgi:hypothetical protein